MHEHASEFQSEEIFETNKTLQELIAFLRDLVFIFFIVIVIRTFFITPFRINGSSMETSYFNKEYIIVDKFSYLNLPVTYDPEVAKQKWNTSIINTVFSKIPVYVGDPMRGDVVVITPHVDRQKEYFIKRVIAIPWDTIRFDEWEVFIRKAGTEKFIQLAEWYLSSANAGQTRLPIDVEESQFTLPEGYYWVMGDNRNNSADSRSCFKICTTSYPQAHFIRRADIVWKVLLNLWYFNIFDRWGLLETKKIEWTHPPRFLSHPREWIYPELWSQ